MPENAPAGTTVGRLAAADRDAHQHHAFALVAGRGGADNGSFSIDGAALKTAAVFDYERRRSYSIRVRATDGGHPARSVERVLTVSVGNVNESPTAISLTRATVAENQPVGTAVGTLSAADPDTGDHHAFALVPGPGATGNGSFAIQGATLRTARILDYEAQSSYSIRVRTTDSGGLTIERALTVTVTDAPELPVAGAKSVTGVSEDGSKAITLSGTDPQGSRLTFAVVSGPQHGALDTRAPAATCDAARPSSCTARVTYTPDPDFNGADTFTYRVDDGSRHSTPATVSIRVDPVDDAPVNSVPAGPLTAIAGADTPIANVSLSDIDAAGDDVRLTLSAVHGTLTVATAALGGVSPLQVAGNGTNAVAVTASLLAIDTTLADANGLAYHGDASYAGPDTLTVSSDDLGHNGSGGPLTDTDTIALSVETPNRAPVADAQSLTTGEDAAKTITLTARDADGDDPLTFAIASPPAHGSLSPIGPVTCDHATPDTCITDITYTPDQDASGPDNFRFTASDGRVDSAPASVSITVTAVDDAPKLQDVESTALAYTENDPATQIASSATVSDVDSPDFDTGTLTVDLTTGGTADDRLEIADQGQIGVSGSDVTFGGSPIGTFAGGTGTTPLVVTLDSNADATATQALVRAITYRNVSDDPSTAARTARFVLTDGDGGTSAAATRDITLTAVNDAPSLAGIEASAVGYVESVDSAPSASQITNSLTVADPDDTSLSGATVQITAGCRSGEDVLAFTAQNGIVGAYTAGSCRLALSGSSSLVNYQTALRSVRYEDTSDTPDTTTRTVSLQVDDGHAANHASNAPTRDITVTAANDSPTGAGDTFTGSDSALAGVTLAVSTSPSTPNVSVSGTVLANDTDPDTPHADLTASAGTSSARGGVVALDSDGTFSYTPPPGFTGTDTFTYTLHDNDATTPRSDSGTVTVDVAGPRVWFVNPAGAAGGNGTSASPLDSLAPLTSGGGSDGLDGNGDVIFVYQGNAASGGFVLENNQRLVGQPQGLSVTNANGTYDLVAAGGANPAITNGSGAGLTLADGNTIRRVDVRGASGVGVTGNAVNTLDYGANTTISGNAGGGLALSGAAGGPITVAADITTSAGHSVAIANRTSGSTTLTGAIDDTGSGIDLSSNTGATVDFAGGLNASTGANDAFTATGGGTVDVDNASVVNTLATTTGTALEVANTTIGSTGLDFRSITAGTSSTGPARGISVVGTGSSGGLTVTGTGTTGGSGGTIQHTTSSGTEPFGSGDGGIYLANTANVSLANMNVSANHASGIYGTGVANLTLAGDSVTANGTDNTKDDDGLRIDGLTGTGTIGTTTISGSAESNARIVSGTSGSLTMNVTGSTFSTATNGSGLLVSANGASITTTATGNTFNQNFSDGLSVLTTGTGTGTIAFTAGNNTVRQNTGAGIDLGTGGGISPPATFRIANNTVTGQQGSGINIRNGGGGTWTGHVTGNTVGDPNTANSGSLVGWGVLVKQQGSGTLTADVSNNTIRQIENYNGVEGSADTGSGTLNLTMTANDIDNQQTTSQDGIFINTGVLASDTSTVCLNATGNTSKSEGTTAGNGLFEATGLAVDDNDANTTFEIPGLPAGSATDDSAVAGYLASNNTLSGPGGPALAQHNASSSGFATVASCPTAP